MNQTEFAKEHYQKMHLHLTFDCGFQEATLTKLFTVPTKYGAYLK